MKLISVLGFANFYATVKDQKLPFKTAYKLTKIAQAMESETQFYRDKLNEIINEYSQKDENGAPLRSDDGEGIKLIEGKEEECATKIIELQNIDIESPAMLTPEELDQLDLTPTQLQDIIPFIED